MIGYDYCRRVYAGWLGKCIGVRHGAPVEGWKAEDIMNVYGRRQGFLQACEIFEADDDINGPYFLMRAMEDEGRFRNIHSEDIALAWLNYPAYEHGFFWWPGYGRPVPYHLLEKGWKPWLESNHRPSEGLGGRIFIDGFAMCCPGDPVLAADIAQRAFRVHGYPGGSGEDSTILQACLISLAFNGSSPRSILQEALKYINPYGVIFEMASALLNLHEVSPNNAQAAAELINTQYAGPNYPGLFHAVPNMGYILCGLLFAGGDFARSLEISTYCGLDTDCNSGNLGVILGILNGLEGIPVALRESVRDIAVCSSVLGDENIGDIPTQAKRIALSGYRMMGQEPPESLMMATRLPLCLDFSLGGEYHGIRALCDDRPDVEAVLLPGEGGLKAWFPRLAATQTAILEHRTYLHPEDVHNSRYDPAFAPKIYPGQQIEARICIHSNSCYRGCLAVRLRDGKMVCSNEVILRSHQEAVLKLQVPGGMHDVVEGVQIRCTHCGEYDDNLQIRLISILAYGAPNYKVDFSREPNEHWNFFHHELCQSTYTRGNFYYCDGSLMGYTADHGEWMSGSQKFTDYRISTIIHPIHGVPRILIRVQGAYRYYALEIRPGQAHILRMLGHGRIETLASAPLPAASSYNVTLGARGNRIIATANDVRLECRDNALQFGCFGVGLTDGYAEAEYEVITVVGE